MCANYQHLNILLFFALEEIGPAIATLIVTVIQGIVILSLGAKELKTNIFKMFDFKFLLRFVIQLSLCTVFGVVLRRILVYCHVHYIIILIIVCALFIGVMFLLNIRRLLKNIKTINMCKTEG